MFLKKVLQSIAWLLLIFSAHAFAQLSAAVLYSKKVPVPELCMYDIVIIDPYSNFNPKDYCNSLSQPFAYVSLGEVSVSAPYIKDIKPSWIMATNKAWDNNKVMNQTKPEWQQFFLDKLIEPLWQQGYRGFFLDTLDSYQLASADPKQQRQQVVAMVKIIKEIKTRHPDAKIILNRGFPLLPEAHADVYAVLIESLYNGWYQEQGKYLQTPAKEHAQLFEEINKIRAMNLPIIIVDYLPPGEKNKAKVLSNQLAQQGFIPWITDQSLQQIYINKFVQTPRKILVVFTNETASPIRFSSALRFIGPILEYMGYIPEYINMEEKAKLPTGNLTGKYAGIVLWLDGTKAYIPLFNWTLTQINHKIPVVFLNQFGVASQTKLIARLGLEIHQTSSSSKDLQITMDPKYIGYEIKPSKEPYLFFSVQSNKGSEVLLQAKNEYGQIEDGVAITSWGGYALIPYVLQFMPDSNAKWVLNPIDYLHDAMRVEDFPIPDITTENGRRLMSVHIDGDGFAYPAKWIGGRYAGAELRDKILKRFQIPTSVSVITGEIAPNGIHPKESPELMKIAKSIFALPWVESASHTFSHPFYWSQRTKDVDEMGEGEGIHIPNYQFSLAAEITGFC